MVKVSNDSSSMVLSTVFKIGEQIDSSVFSTIFMGVEETTG